MGKGVIPLHHGGDAVEQNLHTFLWGLGFKGRMRGCSAGLGPCSLRGGRFKSHRQCWAFWFFRYLVDPASNICLSQRLSHACLSINDFIL